MDFVVHKGLRITKDSSFINIYIIFKGFSSYKINLTASLCINSYLLTTNLQSKIHTPHSSSPAPLLDFAGFPQQLQSQTFSC